MEAKVITAAKKGHNFFILGQAGTGKSSLIRRVEQELKNLKERVQVAASTGLAAAALRGRTVHSFFGIADGRYRNDIIIQKILYDVDYKDVKDGIINTDTLIVDEVSMLSRKVLLQIETVSRAIRGGELPFGGLQVILVGDFFQLKPVPNPNLNDPGELIITEETLNTWIPHQYILTEVHRQTEVNLVNLVHELSRGLKCSSMTLETLQELERPLPPGNDPLKLFALKYDVEMHNSECLLQMEGPMKTYRSKDSGEVGALSRCAAHQKLHLKVGAPVVAIANLSPTLVNGSQGFVHELCDNYVTVKFSNVDAPVDIHPYTFSVYRSDKGKNVAHRRQLPLSLAFALTVHKAQGMTVERLIVDCRNMMIPGQIGVAIGRAKSKSGLQVLNFRQILVQPQPSAISEFYKLTQSSHSPELESLQCCRQKMHGITGQVEETSHTDELAHMPDDDDVDVNSEDEEVIDFLNLFEEATRAAKNTLPPSVTCNGLLDSMLIDTPVTPDQEEMNSQICILKSRIEITTSFLSKAYDTLKALFDTLVERSKNQTYTAFYGSVHNFMSSESYKKCVAELFLTRDVSRVQYRIAYGLIQKLREVLLGEETKAIRQGALEKAEASSLSFSGSVPGLATLRYISGWCIATLRHRKRKMVLQNLYSEGTRDMVQRVNNQVKLLNQLAATPEELERSTEDEPSLAEIRRRDTSRGSLYHVSDRVFKFFMELDKLIRMYETKENVNYYGAELYSHVLTCVNGNNDLTSMWNCLHDQAGSMEGSSELKVEIISKYVNLSSSQYRKELKRGEKVESKEAHRKQIKITSKKPSSNLSKQDAEPAQPSTSRPQEETAKKNVKQSRASKKGKSKKAKTLNWPCGVCNTECGMDCVCCDGCDIWFHYQCLSLYGDEQELQEEKWYCQKCRPTD